MSEYHGGKPVVLRQAENRLKLFEKGLSIMTKKDIFAKYGIEYKNGKIKHPLFGFIPLMLIDGNAKIGKGVFHFSTLPTTKTFHVEIDGKSYDVTGTCACDCVGCYATNGNYRFQSVVNSLGLRTMIARLTPSWLENAIRAQIEADGVETVRIHASGDFFGDEYADMWRRIASDFPGVKMWTYTKVAKYETLFDGLKNANIVKSIIPGVGFNFGHCDYIADVFRKLSDDGKKVHVCRCGIDKNQHCTTCKGCFENEYVLFVEHSTEYNAENDTALSIIREIIELQAARA